jgi:class 3 adenylate cyclase
MPLETLRRSLRLLSLLHLVTNKILKSQYYSENEIDCSSRSVFQTVVDTISQALEVDLSVLEVFEANKSTENYFTYQNLNGTAAEPIARTILQLTVWKTYELKIIHEIGQDERFSEDSVSNRRISSAYQQLEIRSTLLVPFVYQSNLIAVLALHRCKKSQHWQDEEIQFIGTIASQAALAISQVQAYEKLKAFARRESMVNTIAASIRSSLEPQEIFAAIVQELGRALEVDSCTLSLWTKEDTFVECVGLYSAKESCLLACELENRTDRHRKELPQSVVPIAENPVLQRLVKTMKPVVLGDLQQKQDLAGHNLPLRSLSKALLIVPLIVEKEIIGSISLSQRANSRNWHHEDIQLTEAVATQAAIAVQQARLYEKTRQQAELLQESEQKVKKLNNYLTESVLKRFLPESLVDRAATGELVLDLTPEPLTVTILYSDIVQFTQLSERLGANLTAKILNEYLEEMTRIAFKYGGTVDKFIGDGLMVLFGAPESLPAMEQAQRAIATARMMFESLEKLNQSWQERAIIDLNGSTPLKFRCGIHLGTAVVGMFGGGQRCDYTAIGSAVNIAARLQEVAAPNHILISDAIATYLDKEDILQAQLFQLKGIEEKVQTFYVTTDF